MIGRDESPGQGLIMMMRGMFVMMRGMFDIEYGEGCLMQGGMVI